MEVKTHEAGYSEGDGQVKGVAFDKAPDNARVIAFLWGKLGHSDAVLSRLDNAQNTPLPG